ncbi:MAG: DUF4176 domain-containing protein [Lachnospiraceae bacterium]|nr:DUF4176 domain-containing protein [Lachnospiraceae bacterium]
MKQSEEILSLGSIVSIKGSYKKMLIIGRALFVNLPEGKKYFDYAAVTYPEGIMGDQIAYFQHEDMEQIYFHGFTDEEDRKVKQRMENFKKTSQTTRQEESE